MKKVIFKIKTILIIAAASTVTVLAVAIKYHKKRLPDAPKQAPKVVVKQPELVYDPVLLEKFKLMVREFDYNKPSCTYSGVINLDDGKDTGNTVHGLRFLFCKVNKDFYYLLGDAETIHEKGLNLFIQHKQLKMVLTSQNVPIKQPVNNMSLTPEHIRSEGYALESKVQGRKKTLSFLNETHVTCKEFSVTYDTVSNQLEKLQTRLSDFSDPLNKKKDKVIEIDLNKLKDGGNLNQYPSINDVLVKTGGKWKLKAKYAKYELLIM